MGIVIGPFDHDDWVTLGKLKLDLEYTRNHLRDDPDFKIIEKDVKKAWRKYANRVAA